MLTYNHIKIGEYDYITDKGAEKIAKYACKMGHEITIYYEKNN